MGTKQLRETFDAAVGAGFSCTSATLAYERVADVEWQRLTFSGTASDGSPFTTQSRLLKPGTDVIAAARETAERFKGKSA